MHQLKIYIKGVTLLFILLLSSTLGYSQLTVKIGDTTTLSVNEVSGETYVWELYDLVDGIDFAKTRGNCPTEKAKFLNGNTNSFVVAQWLKPGTYFYKVTVNNGCSNNIKIGKVIVEDANIANVTLTKKANKAVITAVDDEIIYTLTVKNLGEQSVNSLVLTDPLTNLNRKIASIAPNDSVVIQTSYYVTAEDLSRGYIENIATLEGKTIVNESFKLIGEKVVTVAFANLSIYKTVDNTQPIIGDSVQFTLTVINNGTVTANKVKVIDKIPSGYTYINDDSNGKYSLENSTWEVGSVKAGESKILNYLLRVNKDGNYVNKATVTYNSLDTDTIDNVDIQATEPIEPITVVKIPEIFSPNGDGIQDYFKIQGLNYFPNAKIRIYNRWGNLVYEQNHYGNTDYHGIEDAWWNGFSNQKYLFTHNILPPATYFYILELNESIKPITGSIFLNNNTEEIKQ